jgi:hypothetical protein
MSTCLSQPPPDSLSSHRSLAASSVTLRDRDGDGDGDDHNGLSPLEWEVTHTSPHYTFDPLRDTDTITALHNWGVELFLKHPLGEPTKPAQTLGQLFERTSTANRNISISAPSEVLVGLGVNGEVLVASVGVGDEIALEDSLLRSDRVDILCMVAGVVLHLPRNTAGALKALEIPCHTLTDPFLFLKSAANTS